MIVVTLVAQGLTLPWVVRKLGLDRLGRDERRDRKRRETSARRRDGARGARATRAGARARTGCRPETVRAVAHAAGAARRAARRCARDPGGDGYASTSGCIASSSSWWRPSASGSTSCCAKARISDEIRRRIERDLDLDEERLRRNVRGIVADEEARPSGSSSAAARDGARSDPEPLPDRAGEARLVQRVEVQPRRAALEQRRRTAA